MKHNSLKSAREKIKGVNRRIVSLVLSLSMVMTLFAGVLPYSGLVAHAAEGPSKDTGLSAAGLAGKLLGSEKLTAQNAVKKGSVSYVFGMEPLFGIGSGVMGKSEAPAEKP